MRCDAMRGLALRLFVHFVYLNGRHVVLFTQRARVVIESLLLRRKSCSHVGMQMASLCSVQRSCRIELRHAIS